MTGDRQEHSRWDTPLTPSRQHPPLSPTQPPPHPLSPVAREDRLQRPQPEGLGAGSVRPWGRRSPKGIQQIGVLRTRKALTFSRRSAPVGWLPLSVLVGSPPPSTSRWERGPRSWGSSRTSRSRSSSSWPPACLHPCAKTSSKNGLAHNRRMRRPPPPPPQRQEQTWSDSTAMSRMGRSLPCRQPPPPPPMSRRRPWTGSLG